MIYERIDVFGPSDMIQDWCRFSADQIIAAFIALILHIAILWGLSLYRLVIEPEVSATVLVKFIALPPPEKTQRPDVKQQAPSPLPEKPKAVSQSKVAPVVTLPVATSPPSRNLYKAVTPALQVKVSQQVEQKAAIPAAEVAPVPLPIEPVALSSELAVICSNRPSPAYPERSKRLRETGTVVIKVLINLDGMVESSQLEQSSGFARLDNAALAAVKDWQCSVPLRDGHAVRAIAFQPFNFGLKK